MKEEAKLFSIWDQILAWVLYLKTDRSEMSFWALF